MLEKQVESLLDLAYSKYKKLGSNCVEGNKLTKKIPVEIEGTVFTGWYEYVCYKVCSFLKEKVPTCKVELILDGNNSQVKLQVTDKEESDLTAILNRLIAEWRSL